MNQGKYCKSPQIDSGKQGGITHGIWESHMMEKGQHYMVVEKHWEESGHGRSFHRFDFAWFRPWHALFLSECKVFGVVWFFVWCVFGCVGVGLLPKRSHSGTHVQTDQSLAAKNKRSFFPATDIYCSGRSVQACLQLDTVHIPILIRTDITALHMALELPG